jgi:hypothetical protein
VDPVLERRAVLDQVQAKAGELALFSHPRVGQPDRRDQVALAQRRQDQRVDAIGLAGERREPLDLLRFGDLDRPAAGLERVVDEPRSGHRLDHGADRFGVDLLDPASEGLQRVDVGWDGELVKVLSVIGEQADIEFLATEVESRVQHVKRASLVLG